MMFSTQEHWARTKSDVEIGSTVNCYDCLGNTEVECDCSCPNCEAYILCTMCDDGQITISSESDLLSLEKIYSEYKFSKQYIEESTDEVIKFVQYTGQSRFYDEFFDFVKTTKPAHLEYVRTRLRTARVDWSLIPKEAELFGLSSSWKLSIKNRMNSYLLVWEDGGWQHTFVTIRSLEKCSDYAEAPKNHILYGGRHL